MVVKQKFWLLKGVQNVLSLSSSAISGISVEDGPKKIFQMMSLVERRIKHFTKSRVFSLISDPNVSKFLHVVVIPNYILPVSYNQTTKGIVINLSSFGTDDIYSTTPGDRNLYACLVYGICFRDLVSGKSGVNEKYAPVISSYLTSLLIRLFGKDYGLLGRFATGIPKLKFLVNVYVLAAFFDFSAPRLYRRGSAFAPFDYKQELAELDKYDFSNIDGFIGALSGLHVMPGINKYSFAAKLYKLLGVNFLPALEDVSRFVSTLTASNVPGSSVVPPFIYKYDEGSFNNVLEISKLIFRRK